VTSAQTGEKMTDAPTSRRWRVRLAAATLAVGSVTAGVVATAPLASSAPTRAQPPKIAPIGKYAVGMRTETFVDTTRPTEGVAPSRTLKTAIYYPAQGTPGEASIPDAPADTKDAPYPLILFSHGLGARGVAYQNVLTSWASAGYVVAAPDYPLSNTDAPGGAQFARAIADTKNQPGDASFVMDQVVKLDKQKQGLGGIVDPRRIGAAGHSLGAVTTYGLAFSSCCADKRVRAAIPMSGIIGVVEDPGQYFLHTATPLLAVHGNADGTVPYGTDQSGFARAKSPKFFLTFLGAGHVTPFLGGDNPSAAALKQSTVDFFNRYLKDDRGALTKLETDGNVPGTSTLEAHPESTATDRTPARTTKTSTIPGT
jgi:predicted dienelactone hydrolase